MIFANNSSFSDHENVVYCFDQETKLKAFIAIHNTKLGPALGGCRIWPYANETDALNDVLRLSRGMTYKSALANLKLGGGKAVIIGDPKTIKTPELLRKFGDFVERLKGLYITAEDVGTTVDDMNILRSKTEYVAGFQEDQGGSGDPSRYTALGVFVAIRACAKYILKKDNLDGVKVAIQGLGNVGKRVAYLLSEAGAHLYVTDIDSNLCNEVAHDLDAQVVVVPFCKTVFTCF